MKRDHREPPTLPPPGDRIEHRLVGTLIADTYRVTRVIGHGGMGIVLEAEHTRLGRPVAVKVLDERHIESTKSLARFEREVGILSDLDHPHVVAILDRGTLDSGQPFLVMERLRGKTLAQRLEHQGRIPLVDAMIVVEQVAAGLSAIHEALVVHRDLKPENVFLLDVADALFVKLLDFGVGTRMDGKASPITDPRQIMGTPLYMAPEQALGHHDRVDGRADQFSLAIVTFEMITGVPPWDGETVVHILHRIIREQAPLLSEVAGGWAAPLDPVLDRALAKDPRDRFSTIRAFAAAFLAAAREVRPERRSLSPPRRSHVSSAGPRSTLPQGSSRPPSDRPSSSPSERPRSRPPSGYPVDVARGVQQHIDAALSAHHGGDAELAAQRVLAALDLVDAQSGSGHVVLPVASELFEAILLDRLGGSERTVVLRPTPSVSEGLTPAMAYLVSMADAVTLGEILATSVLGRLQSLRALALMADRGIVDLRV